MSPGSSMVEQECHVFVRYLARRPATPYVVGKYVAAHAQSPVFHATTDLDLALVAMARRSPARARAADAYARLRAPRSVLRKKLVLLLAILETSAPFASDIDRAPSRALPIAILDLAVAGLIGACAALAGVVALGPRHLVWAMRKRPHA